VASPAGASGYGRTEMETLPLAIANGWGCGISAYAVVLITGLVGRSGVADTPTTGRRDPGRTCGPHTRTTLARRHDRRPRRPSLPGRADRAVVPQAGRQGRAARRRRSHDPPRRRGHDRVGQDRRCWPACPRWSSTPRTISGTCCSRSPICGPRTSRPGSRAATPRRWPRTGPLGCPGGGSGPSGSPRCRTRADRQRSAAGSSESPHMPRADRGENLL
jgi:hypothetical protein